MRPRIVVAGVANEYRITKAEIQALSDYLGRRRWVKVNPLIEALQNVLKRPILPPPVGVSVVEPTPIVEVHSDAKAPSQAPADPVQ